MNKFLLILTLVLITLSSCNRNNVKPEVYNDSLVLHQIRVVENADKLQDAYDSYVEKEMLYRHKELSNQIDASILAVETMEPFNAYNLKEKIKKIKRFCFLIENHLNHF